MNKKNLFKLWVISIPFVGLLLISSYFLLTPKHLGDKTVNILPDKLFGWKLPETELSASETTTISSKAFSEMRTPGGAPQGFPVRLKIPIIGVDSLIEDAVITPEGRMDVPEGSVNVAWFALGPHPGQVGSAVIGGHFGIKDGIPFVFYNLDKLRVGDKVYVLDDKGSTLAFKVRSISLLDRNADATSVFTSSDGLAHLNLITCEGVWNRVNDSYPLRRVVFADAIPSEGAVVVSQSAVIVKKSPALPKTFLESAKKIYSAQTHRTITLFEDLREKLKGIKF